MHSTAARLVILVGSLLATLVACGSGSEAVNDVSEPTIDERFTVGAEKKQVALLCYGQGSPLVFVEPGDDGDGTDGFAPFFAHSQSETWPVRPGSALVAATLRPNLAARWTTSSPSCTTSSKRRTSGSRLFT